MCSVKKRRGWKEGGNEEKDEGIKMMSKGKSSVLFLQSFLSLLSRCHSDVGLKCALRFVNQMLLISLEFVYIGVDCGFSLTDFFSFKTQIHEVSLHGKS